ncbi:MAG: peptidoglycan editing factor PgeF [Actinomycetota bacterium]|nr:peptidoglycan editing factor PgeF [Actinomycetota bacterium]
MTKPAPVRVRRVVTTRAGGRSSGAYSSFNLGDHVGDDPSAVAANRRRLAEGIGVPPQRLVWMEQVHSRTVAVVDGPPSGPLEATDAVVTAARDLALVVVAADCVPVLLADEESGVIAAAHAGRVGARIGILSATLAAMRSLGARTERISVLLGPAVCGQCYEVPEPMQRDVEAHVPGSASRTRGGTPGLDIRAGLRRALLAEGVGAVAQDPRCTMESEELFSHRRQAPTGRLAGVIWTESP